MPPVASKATTHAFKSTLPNPARTAQNSDRSQDSPFASLLDDGTPASSEQPPQWPLASGGKTARTARPDGAQSPAQNSNTAQSSGKTAQPGDTAISAAAGIAAAIAAAVSPDKAAGADMASIDAKISEQTAAGDDAKPAGDGKPSDGLTPADPAAIAASGPIQTIMTVAAVAPVPVPVPGTIAPTAPVAVLPPTPAAAPPAVPDRVTPAAPDRVTQAAPIKVAPTTAGGVAQGEPAAVPPATSDGVAQTAPAAVPQAAPDGVPQAVPAAVPQATPDGIAQAAPAAILQAARVAKSPAIVAAAAPKAKPANFAAPQADTGKPTDNLNSPAKTSFASQGDGKPQPAGDADKQAAPFLHDEVAANPHHTAAAETLPVIAADAQAAMPKAAADAVQQAALMPPSHDASPALANPAAPAAPAAVPLAGIAVEIAGQALAGKNRFEIRLDPPELGRIEVRLDVDRDGHVTSSLIADRSDTLDLLRRDSAGLERALQDAGLKTSDNGLQFSLRDQSTGRDPGHAPTPGAAQLVVNDDALTAIDANPRNYGRLAGLGGGIDIRV